MTLLVWIAIGLLVVWIVTLEGRIFEAFKRIEEEIEELRESKEENND